MMSSSSWSPYWTVQIPMWFNARIDRLCGTQHGIHERFQDTQTQLRITHHPQGTYERWDFSFSIYKQIFRLIFMSSSVTNAPLCNSCDVTWDVERGGGGNCQLFCLYILDITNDITFLKSVHVWLVFLMTLHGQSSLAYIAVHTQTNSALHWYSGSIKTLIE